MYALSPEAAEPRRDVVHDPKFSSVSVTDAVDYEPSLVRRQCSFDFLAFGNLLVAFLAYVFGANRFYFYGYFAASVAAPVWPEFASDP